jgi:hypothetical protein
VESGVNISGESLFTIITDNNTNKAIASNSFIEPSLFKGTIENFVEEKKIEFRRKWDAELEKIKEKYEKFNYNFVRHVPFKINVQLPYPQGNVEYYLNEINPKILENRIGEILLINTPFPPIRDLDVLFNELNRAIDPGRVKFISFTLPGGAEHPYYETEISGYNKQDRIIFKNNGSYENIYLSVLSKLINK